MASNTFFNNNFGFGTGANNKSTGFGSFENKPSDNATPFFNLNNNNFNNQNNARNDMTGSNNMGLLAGNINNKNDGKDVMNNKETGISGGLNFFNNKSSLLNNSNGFGDKNNSLGNNSLGNNSLGNNSLGNNSLGNNSLGNNTGGLFGGNNENKSLLFTERNNTFGNGGLFGQMNKEKNEKDNHLYNNNNDKMGGNTGSIFGSGNRGGGFFSGLNNNSNKSTFDTSKTTNFFADRDNNSNNMFSFLNNKGFDLNEQQKNKLQFGNNNSSFLGNFSNNDKNIGSALTSFNTGGVIEKNNGTYTTSIQDQLLKIKNQWDPNSQKCVFKTYFYNKYNNKEINFLLDKKRPENESPEDWDNIMDKRPSQLHFPIKVTSFTEVSDRIKTQLEHVSKSRILLNNINDKQTLLSSKHDLENTTRIFNAKVRSRHLSKRLLKLVTVLSMLSYKGYPLLPEEEELLKQLEILLTRLNSSDSPIAKLNDIYAKVSILKQRASEIKSQNERTMSNLSESRPNDDILKNLKKNEFLDIINKLSNLLMNQQIGLNRLNEITRNDMDIVDRLLKIS